MRGGKSGTNASSRFTMDYEAKSIYEGIAEDLGGTVGQQVDWFRWQDSYVDENYMDVVDDTYDTSSSTAGKGRRWMLPFKLPTVMAQLIRSSNVMNERGFYVTDTLRLVINVGDAERLIPEMMHDPSSHIKDRILYLGQVYVPTRVLPRGSFGNRWAVVTIDCNQVNSEELVNDPQFQGYATPSTSDRRAGVANLVEITLDEGLTLSPAFSSDVLTYAVTIPTGSSYINITPVSRDTTNSPISVDGVSTWSGMTVATLTPSSSQTVAIVVTSANGVSTKTYSLVITKV
jgi:hypothetical protein